MNNLNELLDDVSVTKDKLHMLYSQILSTPDLKAVIDCTYTNTIHHIGIKNDYYQPGKINFNDPYFTIKGTSCPWFSLYNIENISLINNHLFDDYVLIRVI